MTEPVCFICRIMCPRKVIGGVEGIGFDVVDGDDVGSESESEIDSGSEEGHIVEDSGGLCLFV